MDTIFLPQYQNQEVWMNMDESDTWTFNIFRSTISLTRSFQDFTMPECISILNTLLQGVPISKFITILNNY